MTTMLHAHNSYLIKVTVDLNLWGCYSCNASWTSPRGEAA